MAPYPRSSNNTSMCGDYQLGTILLASFSRYISKTFPPYCIGNPPLSFCVSRQSLLLCQSTPLFYPFLFFFFFFLFLSLFFPPDHPSSMMRPPTLDKSRGAPSYSDHQEPPSVRQMHALCLPLPISAHAPSPLLFQFHIFSIPGKQSTAPSPSPLLIFPSYSTT
ncbi:hypothetical protein BDQ17DRAFT_925192 [Cyathus striatus]|nr:hypothetical protein BDQ17DRAFT_925192 [Cyathus striatus]